MPDVRDVRDVRDVQVNVIASPQPNVWVTIFYVKQDLDFKELLWMKSLAWPTGPPRQLWVAAIYCRL